MLGPSPVSSSSEEARPAPQLRTVHRGSRHCDSRWPGSQDFGFRLEAIPLALLGLQLAQCRSWDFSASSFHNHMSQFLLWMAPAGHAARAGGAGNPHAFHPLWGLVCARRAHWKVILTPASFLNEFILSTLVTTSITLCYFRGGFLVHIIQSSLCILLRN